MADVGTRVVLYRRRFRKMAPVILLLVLAIIGAATVGLWLDQPTVRLAAADGASPEIVGAFSGRVLIQDIGTSSPSLSSDRVVVQMSDVSAPSSGRSYFGYLLNNGDVGVPFGPLPVAGGVVSTTNSFAGRNLIGSYSQVRIIQEGVIFSATLPTAALAHIRTAVDQAGDTPGKVGYSVGLVQQATILHQHAGFAKTAADGGNLQDAWLHTEHVLNTLFGAADLRYKDYDGVGGIENPGDGYGLLRYSQSLSQTLQLAADAADATTNIRTRVAEVQTTLGNIGSSSKDGLWTPDLIAAATDLLAAGNAAQAQGPANQLLAVANRIFNGVDQDDDGIEPVVNEGGALTAHEYTQRAADYLPPGSSGVSGSVQHRDAGSNRKSDQLYFALSGLPVAAAGEQYWAYLVDDQNNRLWLGGLAGTGGTLDGSLTRAGVNLIAGYRQLYVSVGTLYADGALPPAALAHLRTALHHAEDTPSKVGYAVGLMSQAQIIFTHAGFAKAAADSNNLPGAKLHVEHVLNTLLAQTTHAIKTTTGLAAPKVPVMAMACCATARACRRHSNWLRTVWTLPTISAHGWPKCKLRWAISAARRSIARG